MQIFVKDLTRKISTIAEASDSINTVKGNIENNEGISPDRKRLIEAKYF